MDHNPKIIYIVLIINNKCIIISSVRITIWWMVVVRVIIIMAGQINKKRLIHVHMSCIIIMGISIMSGHIISNNINNHAYITITHNNNNLYPYLNLSTLALLNHSHPSNHKHRYQHQNSIKAYNISTKNHSIITHKISKLLSITLSGNLI